MNILARFKIRRDAFRLDVDLELPGSGVTSFFGPSGCGKTSLIRDLLCAYDIRAQGFLGLKEITGGKVTGISLLILPKQKKFPAATTSVYNHRISSPADNMENL